MYELFAMILTMSLLVVGFIVLGAGINQSNSNNGGTWTGLVMMLMGVVLIYVFAATPIPEYKLIGSYDLFDGKTFIGCKVDTDIINVTSRTGRSDITVDGYKWVEYESAGRVGIIKWMSRKRYELKSVEELNGLTVNTVNTVKVL